MWRTQHDWQNLRFGVEIEFVNADAASVELLPGWRMGPDEYQTDETGAESGGELQSPILAWSDREQIQAALARLQAAGARVNWSCGLHVHVGIEPWGEDMILPLIDAALASQDGLRRLFQTPAERMIFCPPVIPAMRDRYAERPERASLVYKGGRPQSHRCGINPSAWFNIGTVEIRYPNATLAYEEICQTVELCLRFVASVGAGERLPGEPAALAAALGAPAEGYPLPHPVPLWARERAWLEDALIPLLEPAALRLLPGGEILLIRPTARGILVAVEPDVGGLTYYRFNPTSSDTAVQRDAEGRVIAIRRARVADALVVQQILHKAHGENLSAGFNFTAATISLSEMEEAIREAETYLLLAGDQPVGTITLWPDRTIGYFGVDPQRMGMGYGRILLAFAEDRGRMKGWEKLVLDTPENHPWLPAFYQRYGFRPVDRTHWEGKRYDSVIMELPLTTSPSD